MKKINIIEPYNMGQAIFDMLCRNKNISSLSVEKFEIHNFMDTWYEIRKHKNVIGLKSCCSSPMITKVISQMGLGEGDRVVVIYSKERSALVPMGFCIDHESIGEMIGRIFSLKEVWQENILFDDDGIQMIESLAVI